MGFLHDFQTGFGCLIRVAVCCHGLVCCHCCRYLVDAQKRDKTLLGESQLGYT